MLGDDDAKAMRERATQAGLLLDGHYTVAKPRYDQLLEETTLDYSRDVPALLAERDALRARLASSQAQHVKTLARLADQAENILAGTVNTVAATIDLQYVSAMLRQAQEEADAEHAQPRGDAGEDAPGDGWMSAECFMDDHASCGDEETCDCWCHDEHDELTDAEQPRGDSVPRELLDAFRRGPSVQQIIREDRDDEEQPRGDDGDAGVVS